ncbi:hypothetical protein RJ639_029690 [Escallonia herrerae]|uniref:Uncharacterized protein n=1 Tax=Escallonia herrerae TaxID=1293975 RepID=A0AA88WZQ8_9ASTE|nr:hypothetical protein RJ639_029690 [Escallonia herrerae]
MASATSPRFVAGTGKGLVEGIKASEPRDTLKLHMNQVLNASGHAGWRLGNLAGHRAAVRRDGEWDVLFGPGDLDAETMLKQRAKTAFQV